MTIEEIAQEILGETLTEGAILEKYDLEMDADELIERLLDYNVEVCQRCGTWTECCNICPEWQCCVFCCDRDMSECE